MKWIIIFYIKEIQVYVQFKIKFFMLVSGRFFTALEIDSSIRDHFTQFMYWVEVDEFMNSILIISIIYNCYKYYGIRTSFSYIRW